MNLREKMDSPGVASELRKEACAICDHQRVLLFNVCKERMGVEELVVTLGDGAVGVQVLETLVYSYGNVFSS